MGTSRLDCFWLSFLGLRSRRVSQLRCFVSQVEVPGTGHQSSGTDLCCVNPIPKRLPLVLCIKTLVIFSLKHKSYTPVAV